MQQRFAAFRGSVEAARYTLTAGRRLRDADAIELARAFVAAWKALFLPICE
jgi:hypothetical protein